MHFENEWHEITQTIAKSVLTAVTTADCFLAAAVVLMEGIQHRPQTGQKCRLPSCTQTCRIRTAGWVQRSVLTSSPSKCDAHLSMETSALSVSISSFGNLYILSVSPSPPPRPLPHLPPCIPATFQPHQSCLPV